MNSLAVARQTGGALYFAQPYNIDAKGFYFDSYEDYTRQAARCRDRFGHPVEEFEIQYIDGPDGELFRAAGLDQSTLHWLDELEAVEDYKKPAVFFLLDNGMASDVGEAIAKADDVCLFTGGLQDAADNLFDECYASDIPEGLRMYIDYEAFARDLRLGGDFVEFDFRVRPSPAQATG